MLVGLVLAPGFVRAEAPVTAVIPVAQAQQPTTELDGGACGDEEQETEEFVHCGAELSTFDQPALFGLLRQSLERMTPNQCLALLDDLYDRQQCRVGGRECGSVLPPAVPSTIELVVAAAPVGQVTAEWLSLDDRDLASLVGWLGADDERLATRTPSPPERPPRAHGC